MATVIPHATRWTGAGSSRAAGATTAGRDAAAEARAARQDCRLLIVFASDAYDLPALLTGVREVAGDTPLVGCSTAGEIAGSWAGDNGVVVMALGGPGFSVATASASVDEHGLREAGALVAAAAAEVADMPHRVLLLLSDGLAGDQQEVVRGAYSVLGASVPLVGGCAGDDLRMVRTSQLVGRTVMSGAIVAAAIGSDAPLGIGVQHGWRRVGEPMLVTDSEGTRVRTLDDEPALDVYLRRLGAPDEAHHDPTAFTRFALTHPLGLSRRSGEEVRMVSEADFSDRSQTCIASVPRGGLAWIMEGDEQSVLPATDEACRSALDALDGSAPLGLLAFDCIARRGVLGDVGISLEVERIAEHAGGAPVCGFYTYGEIARSSAAGGFHNQTLVVLAIG
jgi:hypothetical protein